MFNFTYSNPVRVHFGKGQIASVAKEIPSGSRVLLTYGRGSIKRNGVYDAIRAALGGVDGVEVHEFGGIEANPDFDTLMGAVGLCREKKIDFLLAAGGGSVVDGTKFVSAAVDYVGDPWDIVTGGAQGLETAKPFGCVLTLPATGSEMNCYSVVSRRTLGEKLSFGHPLLFPRFSVLDPETTFTLDARQVGNGIVDAFVHTVEQYLAYPVDAPLQDRFAEGVLRTLIEIGPRTLAVPTDYDPRANLMWCATMALCGVFGVGVPQDWSTHAIGHELTALAGLDHAQTLAVVLPSLLEVKKETKREKLLQFAERVWDLRAGAEEERMRGAIARTREFFESVGVPTRLSAYGVKGDIIPGIVSRLAVRGSLPLGERRDIDADAVRRILELSV